MNTLTQYLITEDQLRELERSAGDQSYRFRWLVRQIRTNQIFHGTQTHQQALPKRQTKTQRLQPEVAGNHVRRRKSRSTPSQ